MDSALAASANVTDTDSAEARARRRRAKQANLSASEQLKSNSAVIVAVIAGVITSAVKFIAAAITGSSAMFSEGIHSMVDAINDSLLLVGNKMSKRKPDLNRPFGYGPEVYFYSLTVALVIFVLGGGFAIYEGLQSVAAGGHPIENPVINYIVLGIGIAVEGFSLSVAVRTVNKARGDMKIMTYIRESKSPTNITVFLEDTAAVLGMVVALIGNIASTATGNYVIDAWASVIIGGIMATVAIILLKETRSLVIGEGLRAEEVKDIVFIVEDDPAVLKCGRVLSLYLAPDELLIALDVTFDDELEEGEVLMAVDRIEEGIMDEYPQANRIFIEPESLNLVYRQRRDRKLAFDAYEEEQQEEEHREEQREVAKQEVQQHIEEKRDERAERREARRKTMAEAFALLTMLDEVGDDIEELEVEEEPLDPTRKKLFSEIPNISGEHIVLNMVVDTDDDAVEDLKNNPAARRWLPRVLFENQYDDISEMIRAMYEESFTNKQSLFLAVRMKDTAELAGIVELYALRDRLHKVSLGLRLREKFWQHEIATEALELIVGYLYEETDIEIVVTSTRVEDERMSKALEDADFIRTIKYEAEDWGYMDPVLVNKWFC